MDAVRCKVHAVRCKQSHQNHVLGTKGVADRSQAAPVPLTGSQSMSAAMQGTAHMLSGPPLETTGLSVQPALDSAFNMLRLMRQPDLSLHQLALNVAEDSLTAASDGPGM